MNLYVGTSGYSYKEWKGKFYPEKMPAKDMLKYYAERFKAVEMNNTFYRMPDASALKSWASQVPGDFKFALKVPQRITHFQRLKNTDESVSQFVQAAKALGPRLGPLLFGLPPNMKKDAARLRDFLSLLPKKMRVAFEFRHASWFDEEIFALLQKRNCALCIAEAEGEIKVPQISTADWGYLRLRLPDYSDANLKKWLKWIRKQTWSDVYIFFKHEETGTGPTFAKHLLDLANR